MIKLCSILKSLLFAYSLLFVVMLFGCRSSKKVTTEVTKERIKDSTVYRELVKIDTFKIPQQNVTVSIPFKLLRDSLLNDIKNTNGRASVRIYRIKDTLYAVAQCDSLDKIIVTKDKELQQWQQYALQQSSKETTVIIKYPWYIKAIMWLAVIYILYYFGNNIYKFLYKRS